MYIIILDHYPVGNNLVNTYISHGYIFTFILHVTKLSMVQMLLKIMLSFDNCLNIYIYIFRTRIVK